MAVKPTREELTLSVDWDIIDKCNGFTFDMGGSVMKVAYVSKDTWVEPSKREKGSKGTLHLVNFSREELDEAFTFLKTNVKFSRTSEETMVEIYTTGMGSVQFSDRFKQELNVTNISVLEFDCFIQGSMYLLNNVPMREVVHPVCIPPYKTMARETEQAVKNFSQMQHVTTAFATLDFKRARAVVDTPTVTDEDLNKPMATDQGIFPCLMIMMGSAFANFLVNKDGSYQMCDGSIRGGRMFLGLGSLLTQADSYSELMALCEKGDYTRVTQTSKYISKMMSESSGVNDKEGGSYSKFAEENVNSTVEEPMFSFGHAFGKRIGDFKKEDIARCLLETMANDVASVVHSCASRHGIKHVFFAGGFAHHPLARQVITLHMLRRDSIVGSLEKNPIVQSHFMVHAPSMGAIGAALNYKLQWSSRDNKTVTDDQGQK